MLQSESLDTIYSQWEAVHRLWEAPSVQRERKRALQLSAARVAEYERADARNGDGMVSS